MAKQKELNSYQLDEIKKDIEMIIKKLKYYSAVNKRSAQIKKGVFV